MSSPIVYASLCMKVTLALFAFALSSGEAMGQAVAPGDASRPTLEIAQNSAPLSQAQSDGSSETRVLILSPQASTRLGETHSALALSNTSFAGDITFRGRMHTVRQLRAGSLPNPWECAWIIWNYRDDHFYYLALKTNGWEIGKRDHAFRGQQRFLKTGKLQFSFDAWHDFEITQRQNEISVSIDGVELATFRDRVRPYTSGKVGFYTEDAEVEVDDISEPFNDDFEDYPSGVFRDDGHVFKNWFVPFLGHGYVAIAAAKK